MLVYIATAFLCCTKSIPRFVKLFDYFDNLQLWFHTFFIYYFLFFHIYVIEYMQFIPPINPTEPNLACTLITKNFIYMYIYIYILKFVFE